MSIWIAIGWLILAGGIGYYIGKRITTYSHFELLYKARERLIHLNEVNELLIKKAELLENKNEKLMRDISAELLRSVLEGAGDGSEESD